MLVYFRYLLLLIGFAFPLQTFAHFGESSSHVAVQLIQEEETIQPGKPFWVAIHLNIEEDWHVYWKNPGDAGMPLKVEWKLPPGFEAGPLQWPFPEKFTVADMVGFGYKGEVILLSSLIPPATLPIDSTIPLDMQIKWLVCSSMTCQPGSASASLTVKVEAQTPQSKKEVTDLFKKARSKVPKVQEVKTIRKEGVVQLEVPHQDENFLANAIVSVYFFPEQKNIIDHSVDPTVAVSTKAANRYCVNLKGSDEIGAKSQILKGVLVVHTQEGLQENVQAFDIDSPIKEANDGHLLSLLDKVEKSKASSPLTIGNETVTSTSSFSFEGGLGLALVFAFLGGMLLNLMPCVLPVMSFKIMGFMKMAGQSRSLTIKHGLMFSLGVLISFWILASAMLILRTYGQSVGWGFQLQEPLFVIILASLLFIFALSLFGVFEWGMFFSSWAGQTQADKGQQSGYFGSFLSGVLATAVATPCTGPFLGSAVGFAVTLPVLQALFIFTSLGLGMSFPYLLLAAFPSCLRFLPKPGAWMEIFKELMGFVLLATVLWLMWVFSAQTNTFSLICVIAGFLCFAIGAWIYGKGSNPLISSKKRLCAYAFVILFAAAGCQAILFPHDSWSKEESVAQQKKEWDGWETFSPERVAELRKQGKPVLIDFTAKWCLICQANHFVLSSGNIEKSLADAGVVKLKADWTKNDPVITKELSKFGRNSVPLYVLYGKDEQNDPLILPQVLTPDVVLQHLEEALDADKGIALE